MHPQDQGFLTKGHEVFGTARFTAMYQRWLKHGERGVRRPVVTRDRRGAEHRPRARGVASSSRMSIVISLPWLPTRRRKPEAVEKGVEKGAARGDTAPARLNPRPQPPPRGAARSASVSSRSATGRRNESTKRRRRSELRREPRDATWGGVLCRPCHVGSVSAGTEPRRERPRLPPRSVTPRAAQGSFTSRFRVSGSEREVRAAACQIASRRAARSRTRGCVISSGRMSRNRAGMHASDRLCRWLPSRTLVSCMRRPSLAARLSGSSCPRHWRERTARTAAKR